MKSSQEVQNASFSLELNVDSVGFFEGNEGFGCCTFSGSCVGTCSDTCWNSETSSNICGSATTEGKNL